MDERRRYQRLILDGPAASFGIHRVVLSDLSVGGAAIEHESPMVVGRSAVLELPLAGERVSIECEIIRCQLNRPGSRHRYRSGLRFMTPGGLSIVPVKNAMARILSDSMARTREANTPRTLVALSA